MLFRTIKIVAISFFLFSSAAYPQNPKEGKIAVTKITKKGVEKYEISEKEAKEMKRKIDAFTESIEPTDYITLDTVQIQVQYAVTYREATEDESLSTDRFALRIGRRYNIFSNNVGGSTDAPPVNLDDLQARWATVMAEMRKHRRQPYEIFRNYPEAGKQLYVYRGDYPCPQYEEPLPELDWELEEGDSTILDYPCQKASADFRGRRWTVWYAMDLPYSEGPWKLTGLPGLILHAHDAAGEFFFDAIDIRKGNGEAMYYDNHRESFKSSPKQMNEMQIRSLRNPKPNPVRLPTGEIDWERPLPRTAVLIEKTEKK